MTFIFPRWCQNERLGCSQQPLYESDTGGPQW